jgi:hypothetical protein
VRAVGIDLGASALHAVALELNEASRLRVTEAALLPASDLDAAVAFADGATALAIDAPSELSRAPHGDDEALSPKFRRARCAEIALGQDRRIWVPWTTPERREDSPEWMRVGFDLWAALRRVGHEPVEVYPAGVFRALTGKVLPKKTTAAGLAARIASLVREVDLPSTVAMWSHDGVDAAGAALVAAWSGDAAKASGVGHSHPGADGSAIWLPTASGEGIDPSSRKPRGGSR